VQSYDSLTDQQAEKLTRDALEVDQSVAQLREIYPDLSKGHFPEENGVVHSN
jgi:hypothetical protein